jgi:hypothetical protein
MAEVIMGEVGSLEVTVVAMVTEGVVMEEVVVEADNAAVQLDEFV